MEQKIKQTDIFIGKNIRKIRLSKGIHQTETCPYASVTEYKYHKRISC